MKEREEEVEIGNPEILSKKDSKNLAKHSIGHNSDILINETVEASPMSKGNITP